MSDKLVKRLREDWTPIYGGCVGTMFEAAERIEQLEALLHDASEFLDNYSDVIDGLDGQPEANDAMILKQEIDRMLENKHD
jgi:hypothetical protein